MEFPRHVHRPIESGGFESKIVTADEWPAAESDGWLIDPNVRVQADAPSGDTDAGTDVDTSAKSSKGGKKK